MPAIKRQRHIIRGFGQLPVRGNGLASRINNYNFIRLGDVSEDALALRVDVERLRVSRHRKVGRQA